MGTANLGDIIDRPDINYPLGNLQSAHSRVLVSAKLVLKIFRTFLISIELFLSKPVRGSNVFTLIHYTLRELVNAKLILTVLIIAEFIMANLSPKRKNEFCKIILNYRSAKIKK